MALAPVRHTWLAGFLFCFASERASKQASKQASKGGVADMMGVNCRLLRSLEVSEDDGTGGGGAGGGEKKEQNSAKLAVNRWGRSFFFFFFCSETKSWATPTEGLII